MNVLGKIFTVCTVSNECTRGNGAADFIVPMQLWGFSLFDSVLAAYSSQLAPEILEKEKKEGRRDKWKVR